MRPGRVVPLRYFGVRLRNTGVGMGTWHGGRVFPTPVLDRVHRLQIKSEDFDATMIDVQCVSFEVLESRS